MLMGGRQGVGGMCEQFRGWLVVTCRSKQGDYPFSLVSRTPVHSTVTCDTASDGPLVLSYSATMSQGLLWLGHGIS